MLDHRTAGLLLYALQIASANVKFTFFEPEPTHVVIDRECVAQPPLGATAWSKFEGLEYDDLSKDEAEKMKSAALTLVYQKFGPKWVSMIEDYEPAKPVSAADVRCPKCGVTFTTSTAV
ncbi:MAG: hypothetical protein ABSA27_11875 [Terriglobales bacterium]|jgi:hypothetical protein